MFTTQRRLAALVFLIPSAFGIGCSQPVPTSNATASAPPTQPDAVPAGELRDELIALEFAIYYLPQPTKEPIAELQDLLREQELKFRLVPKLQGQDSSPTVAARLETNPRDTYAPPDVASLEIAGLGLSLEQAEALQKTEVALILNLAYPKDQVWSGLRATTHLIDAVARATGGFIWDEATREVFTPEAWQEQRIAPWTDEIPDITTHTTIHTVRSEDGEVGRVVTFGMSKFGVPDVLIEDFSWPLREHVEHLAALFAQSIVEGAVVREAGQFDLDVKAIANSKVREAHLKSLKPTASGVAWLSLKMGRWKQGDPVNRLIELTFDRGVGSDLHARQQQIVSAAFGWEESAESIKHDAELEAASRQARTKLSALRPNFDKGLAAGELILVKAPFDTPDGGQEWMWVQITSWRDDRIMGLLKNEPFSIPNLHAGQTVEVSEETVFDYVHHHGDGTEEGNLTGKLLEGRRSN